MKQKKKTDSLSDDKQPKFEIYSLRDTNDLDFFPHLKSNDSTEHGKILGSLKDGTYTPFMTPMEYEGTWDKKNKTFSASLINTDIITDDKYRKFSASFNSDDKHNEFSASFNSDDKHNEFSASFNSEQAKLLDTLYGKEKRPIRRRFYANPRQYYDHILLADGYTNSFAGTVIDTWVDFNIPREIHPVLKLRQGSKNKDDDRKEIAKNQYIIDTLEKIDLWYSDMGPKKQDDYFDIPLQQKFKAAFKLREVFGRDIIVKENWEHLSPVTVDDTEYKNLPNTLKVLHPVEIGITEIELYTGKVSGVWIHNDQPYIQSKNIIHFVNEFMPPTFGAMSYGFSKLQRSLDPVRLYRRLLAKNFPQYLRTSASGMGAFILNTTGYDSETRQKIRTALKNSYRTAELAVIDYANIDNFEFKEFKINTDINALVALEQAMLKTISNVIGVPQSIVYDDSAPARATLVGRILTFMNNTVAQSRTTFRQQLASQWYMPNFREVFKDQKDILEKFYIDVEIVDVSFETKQEKIDRLIQETQLNAYTDEYLGEELEDPDYLAHIDPIKNKENKENMKNNIPSEGKKTGGTISVRNHATGEKSTFTES